jgi:hypothetical protein
MTLNLTMCEEIPMSTPSLDGDLVLGFVSAIESAMDDAGTGQHRAFKLLASLRTRGLAIKAIEMPAAPAALKAAE